jgi:hypothetical protein
MKYLVPLAKGEVMVLLPVRARGRFRCYFSKLLLLIKDHLLNGTKNWITNGSSASTYIVIAQTDIEKGIKELTLS